MALLLGALLAAAALAVGAGGARAAATVVPLAPDGTHYRFHSLGHVDAASGCSGFAGLSFVGLTSFVDGEVWYQAGVLHARATPGFTPNDPTDYSGTIGADGQFHLEGRDGLYPGLEDAVDGRVAADGALTGTWTGPYVDPCVLTSTMTNGFVELPPFRLRVTGSDYATPVAARDLGERIWLEATGSPTPLVARVWTDSHPAPTSVALDPASGELRSGGDGILITAFPDRARGKPYVEALPGDVVHVEAGGQAVAVRVAAAAAPDVPDADVDLELEREHAPEAIAGAPGGPSDLSVRLRTRGGVAIEGAQILWAVPRLRLRVVVPTDEDGISTLQLGLRPNGEYAVIANGDPVAGASLPLGPLSATAAVVDEAFRGTVRDDPQVFAVRLERPVLISFLDRDRGAYLDGLVAGQPFQLEVRDLPPKLRHDLPEEAYVRGIAPADSARPTQMPAEIEATVRLPSGEERATLYREPATPQSLFYLGDRDIATPKDVEQATSVTAEYGGARATIPLYRDWTQRETVEIGRALGFYERLLRAAQASPDLSEAQAEELAVRAAAIANGRRLIRDPDLSPIFHVVIGARYLGLVGSKQPIGPAAVEAPDPARMPFSRTPWASKLAFASAREAAAVYEARAEAHRVTRDRLVGLPKEIATAAWEAVKSLPNVLASPVYGGYTLFTGRTLDGQRATVLERVLGGVDLALVVVPVVKALPRLAPLLRARGAARVEAAAAAAAKVGRLSKVEQLEATAALHESHLASAEAQLAKTKALHAAAEQRLAELRRDLAETSARAVKTREKLLDLVESARERVVSRATAIAERARLESRHASLLAATRARIARLNGVDLTLDELRRLAARGELPAATDKIGGYNAQWHYEQQLNRDLQAAGFVPGKRLFELETPYTQPHGGLGSLDLEDPVRVHNPHPDHMNLTTFDLADSKYYDFVDGYATEKLQVVAARTISDTIEKARIFQTRLAQRFLPRATSQEITERVLRSKVTIFTPTGIPRDVEAMIRDLVSRGNDAWLEFRVQPARPLEWATAKLRR